MTDFDLCPYEAVLFDLDSTLTNTKRYPIRASEWILARLVDDVEQVLEPYIRELLENYRIGIESVVNGGRYRSPYDIVKMAIGNSLNAIGVDYTPEILDEAITFFKQLHIESSAPVPGVEHLLSSLRSQDYLMGVFTNSFEGHAEVILRNIGLLDFFDVVADPGMARGFKPMPVTFEFMLSQIDVSPEKALFVGNEFLADIFGSISAGLDAVWINSKGRLLEEFIEKFGEDYRPRAVLGSVSELVRFVCS